VSIDVMGRVKRAELSKGNVPKVFDWDKAAQIIKSRNISNASAGLQGDLSATCGDILEEGVIPEEGYAYLMSTWAIPVLIINPYTVEEEEIECWRWLTDVPYWGSDTFWPDSARDIFNQKLLTQE